MGALVTKNGVISVRLHSGVQVDLTVDKAIRLLNYQVTLYKIIRVKMAIITIFGSLKLVC